VAPTGVAAPPRTGRGLDAVGMLTIWLVIAVTVPSPLIFKPLGGSGTPANVFGLGLLGWWALAKLGGGDDIDRGRQPLRIALLLVMLSVMASLVVLYLRTFVPKESTGAERGVFFLAAFAGVALVAADGISSIERLHTLMKRVVHGIAFVAAVGVYQFVTGYNPGRSLNIPSLTRNIVVFDQGRLSFVRVQSTALHPIELGVVLGLGLPLAIQYALHEGRRGRRVLAWLEVGLIGVVEPMCLSRTGIIVTVIGLAAVGLDWSWRRRLATVALGAGFLVGLNAVIHRLLSAVVTLFTHIAQDDSTTARLHRYGIAGHYLLQHPVFGRGFNTLYPATGQIFDNWYLYTLTETGVVGLAALLLLFAIMIFTARGARRRAGAPIDRALAQALAGSIAACMIAFATSDIMSFTMATGLLFLILGAAGALWRLTGGPGRSDDGTDRAVGTAPVSGRPEPALV